jgi:hypothetical protein
VVDYHKKWTRKAYRQARLAVRGERVLAVVASGPPFSGVWAAYVLAKRVGAPLIVDFRDPCFFGWTFEGPMRYINRNLARLIERRVMAASTAVLCASPGIGDLLRRGYPDAAAKIHEVINGFDATQPRRRAATGGNLSILFAGALYMNRDPFPFLEALDRLLADPRVDAAHIQVDFVGGCSDFGGMSLAGWLKGRRAAAVVRLTPSVPEPELKPFMERATTLLNLAQAQPRQIPAKTFEHLASGSEVIAICEKDSDTGRILEGIPGVHRIDPDDALALDATLRDLYRRHVLDGQISAPPEAAIRGFSREAQTDLFLSIFRSAVVAQPAPET